MIMINYKTKTSLFVSTYIVLILFDTFRVLRLYAKGTRQFARVLQNFAFNCKSYRSVYSLKEISFN